MPQQAPIDTPLPGDDGNRLDLEACKRALEGSFEEICRPVSVTIGSAAGAELPKEFENLKVAAQDVGWAEDVAEEAIRKRARERMGAAGATFD